MKCKPRPIARRELENGSASGGWLQGWLQGRDTYLWIENSDGSPSGTLHGYGLYRLAKAIVRQFELECDSKAQAEESDGQGD